MATIANKTPKVAKIVIKLLYLFYPLINLVSEATI
ncbi:hypothetical protein SSU98_1154 [Streptococcus suis 98HAH33]|nr:hypothetical protein SSU05_1139 [Streptococcus suis 05ZYH33]ABP92313.1 hypothetical protein SSU98_1154 [Streptococcus suis 98HAH33]